MDVYSWARMFSGLKRLYPCVTRAQQNEILSRLYFILYELSRSAPDSSAEKELVPALYDRIKNFIADVTIGNETF